METKPYTLHDIGEGDREADRAYRAQARQFVDSGRLSGAVTEAAAAYENGELRGAEEAAQAHAQARVPGARSTIESIRSEATSFARRYPTMTAVGAGVLGFFLLRRITR